MVLLLVDLFRVRRIPTYLIVFQGAHFGQPAQGKNSHIYFKRMGGGGGLIKILRKSGITVYDCLPGALVGWSVQGEKNSC